MKKSILLLIFTFLIAVYSKTQIHMNNLSEMHLKGNVKSIYDKTYDSTGLSSKLLEHRKCDSSHILFNKKGDVTEEYYFNDYGFSKIYISKSVYAYNSYGKKVSIKHYSSDGLKLKPNFDSQCKFKYNSKGLLIEENEYEFNGDFLLNTFSTYDLNGNLKEQSFCARLDDVSGKEGECVEFNEYLYDSTNRLVETIMYDRAESNTYKYTNRYDEKGNIIESTHMILTSGIDPLSEYKYSFKFDDYGNITESTTTNLTYNTSTTSIYSYEYDKNNNWLRMSLKVDTEPSTLTERIIKYY